MNVIDRRSSETVRFPRAPLIETADVLDLFALGCESLSEDDGTWILRTDSQRVEGTGLLDLGKELEELDEPVTSLRMRFGGERTSRSVSVDIEGKNSAAVVASEDRAWTREVAAKWQREITRGIRTRWAWRKGPIALFILVP